MLNLLGDLLAQYFGLSLDTSKKALILFIVLLAVVALTAITLLVFNRHLSFLSGQTDQGAP
jgi:hypothetical protein